MSPALMDAFLDHELTSNISSESTVAGRVNHRRSLHIDGQPLRALADAIRKTGWHGWLVDEEERPDLQHKPGTATTGPSRKTMKEIFGV